MLTEDGEMGWSDGTAWDLDGIGWNVFDDVSGSDRVALGRIGLDKSG